MKILSIEGRYYTEGGEFTLQGIVERYKDDLETCSFFQRYIDEMYRYDHISVIETKPGIVTYSFDGQDAATLFNIRIIHAEIGMSIFPVEESNHYRFMCI